MARAQTSRSVRRIPLIDLIVDEGPRPLNEAAVRRLSESIAAIGMHTPVHVELAGYGEGEDYNPNRSLYRVVAGRHRVAAAKALKWSEIEAIDFYENPVFQTEDGEVDDAIAEMWAISENLHRQDLTALQRDEQIARWIELNKLRQAAPVSGGRGNEGGVRAATRELGIDHRDARRAIEVAALSDDAKDTAVELGVDDNRSALLAAAKQPVEQQAAALRARVVDVTEARRNKIDGDVKSRAAREVAEMLAEHVPGEWWDGLKANLYAAGASNIAHELTNITGQSIMDRNFA